MLYKTARKCGITPSDYWNMTLGEIKEALLIYGEQKKESAKEKALNNYQLALFITSFMSRANNGKQPPTLQEILPTLFADEEVPEAEDNSWIIYKEKMLDYANAHNQIVKEVSEQDDT